MWTGIEKMIREDWSPEQISGQLKDIGEPSVSPEWIYQYIYADKRNGGDGRHIMALLTRHNSR